MISETLQVALVDATVATCRAETVERFHMVNQETHFELVIENVNGYTERYWVKDAEYVGQDQDDGLRSQMKITAILPGLEERGHFKILIYTDQIVRMVGVCNTCEEDE